MRKAIRKICRALLAVFLVMNVVAFFHAYKFTHFAEGLPAKTKNAGDMSFGEKLSALFLGVKNPRPENKGLPTRMFETVTLQSNKKIVGWSIPTAAAKGTVILFHGYGGSKSSLLDKSDEFLKLGYSTLLIDFMGCGASEGNQTTIGFKEAEEVRTAFDYLRQRGEEKIVLFGTSLGAAAIMKAVSDYKLPAAALIVECPFGSMYQTVCARFRSMQVPPFPMAPLLVFWGGVQNGFWAFGHNPSTYARGITCPVLLLYGEKDEKVSREETDEIFANLGGKKTLRLYPLVAHENYLHNYCSQWVEDVRVFLDSCNEKPS